MKSILTVTLSSLLPVLGLVSCVANPNTTEGEKIADPWSLPAPEVRSLKDDYLVSFDATQTLQRSVSADGSLVFPVRDPNGFKDVSLSVETVCLTSSQAFRVTRQFQGLSHLAFVSMLPEEVLQRLDLEAMNGIRCDFKFLAKNSVGSTHAFEMKNVVIDSFQNLENIGFKHKGSGKIETSIFVGDASKLALQELPSLGNEAEFRLHCSHFVNFRKIAANQVAEGMMADLLTGEIENDSADFKQAHAGPDPRERFSLQECRIVAKYHDHEAQSHRWYLTPRIRVQFEPKLATVSRTENFERFDVNSFKSLEVAVTTVVNPSQVPMAFRYPKETGRSLLLQAVQLVGGQALAGRVFSEPLQITIEGATRAWDDGDVTVFEVAPGAKAVIRWRLSSGRNCRVSPLHTGSVRQGTGFVGFTYRYENSFVLNQYLNWNPAHPDLKGATHQIHSIEPNSELGGVLTGWHPFSTWLEVMGTSARPTIAPYTGGQHVIFTCLLPHEEPVVTPSTD